MPITPYPGADRGNILQSLTSVHTSLGNLSGRDRSTAYAYLLSYLRWVTDSSRLLRHQLRDADVRELILTDRYQALLDGVGHLAGSQQEGFVNGLVDLEIEERLEAFSEAIGTFTTQSERWGAVETLIVADSSFYVHHPDRLENVDLSAVSETIPETGVHLLVPLVIIDELDRLKETGRSQPRWRARHALAVLDRILDADGRGTLHPAGAGRGAVSVEIIFDEPGHARLPDEDDEIVDRAVAVQAVAGRPVKLLTYDTGQSTRARFAGLTVKKFPDDPEPAEEPDWAAQESRKGTGTRARRKERQAALGEQPAEE
ncbi:PIN domain-containing protein [Streptomyces sp. NPDC005732]|uniref:PIN domain-containing protein n=1 Tax=Streptomyces sp. NPDC005732 TaxID=3157057 RepID=UPI0033EB2F24